MNQIQEKNKRLEINQIAVDNFLSSLGGVTKWQALQNLDKDAELYKWNLRTCMAINDGINNRFKDKSCKN